jgi:class 3 adenylate cyclase/energy-coupling factor transporter ATP-binding protein EcfA2
MSAPSRAPAGADRSTAIRTFLIADVRGYTVFTHERGDELAARLAGKFAALARAVVEAHAGTLLELRGDEALAVFDSARQAIRAAVALQLRFVEETVTDPTLPLAVGIGLDAGEAVAVDGGYRGGALNLAARLCGLARPGEVLASREIAHLARRVEGIRFADRGPVRLKGFAEPVDVIRIRPESEDLAEDTAFRRALGPAAALPTALEVANPYKGLRAFEEADAPHFFGREALTDQLVARLAETRFLAVVGPSGSGKSSVVRAGLVPELRKGALPDSDRWHVVELFPGAYPLEELEAALLRIAVNPPASLLEQLEADELGLLRAVKRILPEDGSELVLVVDQLEEVFTLVEDEERRTHFLALLETAVQDPRARLRVVTTLRADFYDRPLLYRGFAELLRDQVEVVVPLSPEEFERAISAPAELLDLTFERGLVAEMVADVANEPGALPLLEYALSELFERREGRVLTREAYRAIGGVSGALAGRAEKLYSELDETGREAARQLFLRLVTLGDGTEDARRRVERTELASLDIDQVALTAAIDAFGTSRLLSFDRDPRTRSPTVEVAHEALLREWTRLGGWIDAARDDVRIHRRLSAEATEWTESGRDPSFLLRGSQLDQFASSAGAAGLVLTEVERDFLATSLEQKVAEQRAEQERVEQKLRQNRRLRIAIGVVGVALAAAIVGGLLAFRAQDREAEARSVAEAGRLGALGLLDNELDRSLLLARGSRS